MAGASEIYASRWIPDVNTRASMPAYFLSACSAGDIQAAQVLFDNGFNPAVDMNTGDKWQIFINLCQRNDMNMIKFLFPGHISFDRYYITGDDVDEYTFVRTVPICVALKYCNDGNHEILDYFLDNGADIESDITIRSRYYPTDTTFSLVKYAMTLGRGKTVRYLVSRGACLEGCSIMFMVRWACFNNSVDLLQFAIEQGAKFKNRSYFPLHWCMINPEFFLNYEEDIEQAILTSLLFYAPGVELDERDFTDGSHRIGTFCPDKQLEMLKILLEFGLDPNKQEPSYCMTAGHMVCRGDKVEQYRLLLAHGWDINQLDTSGCTALHNAAFGNDPSAVKYLIENGAELSINLRNEVGFTPLHCVTLRENLVGVFEKFSALWHTQDHKLFTSSKCEIIAYLLSHGADVNCRIYDYDILAEMMCGSNVFYETLSWLMENTNSKVPYGGKYWDLPVVVANKFVYTDCLIPAGFQSREFIREHMQIALENDNMSLYRTALYANPYSIYDISPDTIFPNGANLWQTILQHASESNVRSPSFKSRLISVMRDNQLVPDASAKLDYLSKLGQPPELLNLALFSVRKHLLWCRNNKSILPTIEKLGKSLPLPHMLTEMLCLKTFKDCTKE